MAQRFDFFSGTKQAGFGDAMGTVWDYTGGPVLGAAGNALRLGLSAVGNRTMDSVSGIGSVERPKLSEPVAQEIENKTHNSGVANIFNYLLAGGLLGGGLAGASALVRRLREPNKEEEEKQLRRRVGPILEIKRAVENPPVGAPEVKRAPSVSSVNDVGWSGPGALLTFTGGSVLGYLLLRNIFDKQEEKRLKDKRIRAEQSFTKSVSHALKPQGLRLTAKRASIDELTNEELVMIALDDYAVKKADGWDKAFWWSMLPLAAAAGVGTTVGWNLSAAKNPNIKELKDIKTRKLLEAVNSPLSPILTIADDGRRARQAADEEEEDDQFTLDE